MEIANRGGLKIGGVKMSRLLSILRWTGALFVALSVHIIVFALGGFIYKYLGTNVITTVNSAIFVGTFLAVALGATVAPGEQRKNATFVLCVLFCAYYLWPLLTGYTGAKNISLFGSALTGGLLAYIYVGRTGLLSGRKINPVSAPGPEKGPTSISKGTTEPKA
jgi:hypothetical protein